jgi:IclR family transcriptional regulator, acetate operon repressor
MSNEATNSGPVRSVERAVALIELLAQHGVGGVTELSKAIGVHKSTASRLLMTLQKRGLVEQSPDTGKYRIGIGLVRLAATASADLDLKAHAAPLCSALAEEVGETVNVAVLDGDQALNIDEFTVSASVIGVSWLGRRSPLYCTATGKVLLAHMAEAVRARVLAGPRAALTPNSIVDLHALEAQLEDARVAGYASTEEELEPGMNAVAAPVRGAGSEVIAALSISGPSYRVSPGRLPELGRRVAGVADELSARLGFDRRSTHAVQRIRAGAG